MSASKREEVSSHLRYIRLELREMHQMLIRDDLLPDLSEAKEVHAQLDALYELLSDKRKKKVKKSSKSRLHSAETKRKRYLTLKNWFPTLSTLFCML